MSNKNNNRPSDEAHQEDEKHSDQPLNFARLSEQEQAIAAEAQKHQDIHSVSLFRQPLPAPKNPNDSEMRIESEEQADIENKKP